MVWFPAATPPPRGAERFFADGPRGAQSARLSADATTVDAVKQSTSSRVPLADVTPIAECAPPVKRPSSGDMEQHLVASKRLLSPSEEIAIVASGSLTSTTAHRAARRPLHLAPVETLRSRTGCRERAPHATPVSTTSASRPHGPGDGTCISIHKQPLVARAPKRGKQISENQGNQANHTDFAENQPIHANHRCKSRELLVPNWQQPKSRINQPCCSPDSFFVCVLIFVIRVSRVVRVNRQPPQCSAAPKPWSAPPWWSCESGTSRRAAVCGFYRFRRYGAPHPHSRTFAPGLSWRVVAHANADRDVNLLPSAVRSSPNIRSLGVVVCFRRRPETIGSLRGARPLGSFAESSSRAPVAVLSRDTRLSGSFGLSPCGAQQPRTCRDPVARRVAFGLFGVSAQRSPEAARPPRSYHAVRGLRARWGVRPAQSNNRAPASSLSLSAAAAAASRERCRPARAWRARPSTTPPTPPRSSTRARARGRAAASRGVL